MKNDKLEAGVKQLLYEQMEVESPVHLVETVRLGRQTENPKGPRPVTVTLRSPAERSAVLHSAHRLKELNLELRQRASRTIGIDVFGEEKAIKDSLWPKSKAAKEAGQKAYFRGCKLFVNGIEVQP